MKKEYTKPIVEVTMFCNSENILSASRPEKPVNFEFSEDGSPYPEEEDLWDGMFYGDWEVD